MMILNDLLTSDDLKVVLLLYALHSVVTNYVIVMMTGRLVTLPSEQAPHLKWAQRY